MPREDVNIIDSESKIEYILSKPSIEYILASFFLMLTKDFNLDEELNHSSLFLANFQSSPMYKNRNFSGSVRLKSAISMEYIRSLRMVSRSDENLEFKNSLINLFRRTRTVTIKSSETELNLESYNELYNSFLFSLNYVNLPFIEFRNTENRIKGPHRIDIRNLEAPKRIYNREPLYYYHQALSTDNPVLKFLSYYQVLEYFYNIVSEEHLKENVKLIITNPAFSSENEELINKLIKFVKKAEYRYKEKYSLQLVLEKHLNVDELKQDLNSYDITSYNHVMSGNVDFVEVPNLINLEDQEFNISLANRIYNIRNALIHSKEGEKHRYVPFSEHEVELKKELALMRLLAEQVIIRSSERLNINRLESHFR